MSQKVINLNKLSDAVTERHRNVLVSQVNDSSLRMAVNQDNTFPWHRHTNSDELFIVLSGELVVEFPDGPVVTLRSNDAFLVLSGQIHRTRAIGRTVNLCIEKTDADTVVMPPGTELRGVHPGTEPR